MHACVCVRALLLAYSSLTLTSLIACAQQPLRHRAGGAGSILGGSSRGPRAARCHFHKAALPSRSRIGVLALLFFFSKNLLLFSFFSYYSSCYYSYGIFIVISIVIVILIISLIPIRISISVLALSLIFILILLILLILFLILFIAGVCHSRLCAIAAAALSGHRDARTHRQAPCRVKATNARTACAARRRDLFARGMHSVQYARYCDID